MEIWGLTKNVELSALRCHGCREAIRLLLVIHMEPAVGIDLEYGGNKPLEDLLAAIDHPGDFCTHRRLFAPMPRLEVEGVGMLSFPVPLAQLRAMLAVAERAPYGKGEDTLVDTSVRDCWQIDASRIRLAGSAWSDTFGGIVADAAQGLGCAAERWLDGWTSPDGRQPPFDEAPLLPGELLPDGALDDVPPDEQWLHESSGNEGVSLERAYRRAAFVIWPRCKTLEVLADSGINGAVDWVAEQLAANDGVGNEQIGQFCERLIRVWPGSRFGYGWRNAPDHKRMLDLLAKNGAEAPVRRFLNDAVLKAYRGAEDHEAIMGVLHLIRPDQVSKFLAKLTKTHFVEKSEHVLALLRRVLERYQPAGVWREPLRECARSAFAAFGTLPLDAKRGDISYMRYQRPDFSAAAIRDLFVIGWRCGLTSEAEQAAGLVIEREALIEPERTLAEILPALHQEDGLPAAPAYAVLWRHATERLLARSETPPAAPQDWRIKTRAGCSCANCKDLRSFCRDPVATTARFAMREGLRAHLEDVVRRADLDIDMKTEKKGRPYTLVCTKNRASYRRRLAEYAEDVDLMDGLAKAVADAASAFEIDLLHQAVAAGRRWEAGSQ